MGEVACLEAWECKCVWGGFLHAGGPSKLPAHPLFLVLGVRGGSALHECLMGSMPHNLQSA
eukprot:68429-Chlamydomonas_euryale.AAC.1